MDRTRIELLDHGDPTFAKAIHRVQMAAYAQEARLLGAKPFPPLQRTPASIRSSQEHFWGAFLGKVLVGSLGLEAGAQPNEINISSLVVTPECQRRGIARRLLARALEDCEGRAVTVSTAASNTGALRLYAAFGFVEQARQSVGPEEIELVNLRRAP